MDLSSVIYHTACQCQYKCLMESTHSPLKLTHLLHKTGEKICSDSRDKICIQHLRDREICIRCNIENKFRLQGQIKAWTAHVPANFYKYKVSMKSTYFGIVINRFRQEYDSFKATWFSHARGCGPFRPSVEAV